MRNINKIYIIFILFLSLATINNYACIPIPPDGSNNSDDNDSGDPCDPNSSLFSVEACNGGDCSALNSNDSGDPCDPNSCQWSETGCNNGDCSALDSNDSGDPCDPNSCQWSEAGCNNGDCSALDSNDSGDPCDPNSCQWSVAACNNGDCSVLDDNDSGDPCDPNSCQYNVDDCKDSKCDKNSENYTPSKCDCAGVFEGTAHKNDCDECIGGTTQKTDCFPFCVPKTFDVGMSNINPYYYSNHIYDGRGWCAFFTLSTLKGGDPCIYASYYYSTLPAFHIVGCNSPMGVEPIRPLYEHFGVVYEQTFAVQDNCTLLSQLVSNGGGKGLLDETSNHVLLIYHFSRDDENTDFDDLEVRKYDTEDDSAWDRDCQMNEISLGTLSIIH